MVTTHVMVTELCLTQKVVNLDFKSTCNNSQIYPQATLVHKVLSFLFHRQLWATMQYLTNWHPFFMHLSTYWSWISSHIVKVAVVPRAITEWYHRLLWQYYDKIHCKYGNRTDEWKPDVSVFFTITNCQIVCSSSLTHRINYKFMCLSAYWRWKLANECATISVVIIKNELKAEKG